KQYGEEPLAAVMCVALNGFIQGKGAVETAVGERLAGGDGRNGGADGLQVRERISLSADEELRVGPHHGGVGKVDGGDHGATEPVVPSTANNANDRTPAGAFRKGDLEAIRGLRSGIRSS